MKMIMICKKIIQFVETYFINNFNYTEICLILKLYGRVDLCY